MGYACPVCSDPQADAGHLANHLAFTAMTGGEDHETWLDDHVDDWGSLGESELAEIVVEHAEEEEFPQVFEESGVDDGHNHGHGGTDDLPPGAEQSRSQSMSDADESVLAEARELTKEMLSEGDAESESDADSESESAEDETESSGEILHADMETEGTFSPATVAEATQRYESLGSTAQVVVKEIAKAMGLDAEAYNERVTGEVVETARDVLFAESLAVTVGTREEFEAWREDADHEVELIGSENVEQVVWHAPAFSDRAVAATFHSERAAAVGTLRRQAFGRIYTEVV